MKVRIMNVGPSEAASWLSNGRRNRHISEFVVARYTREMEAGLWQENGDSIRFDVDGKLIDGQHRLKAIIRTGISMECVVVEDLPRSAFETLDRGKRRSTGDSLSYLGESNANCLAGALHLIWKYEHGTWHRLRPSQVPSPHELIELLEEHPGLREFIPIASLVRKIIAPSMAVGLAYLFSRVDADLVPEFFTKLASGADCAVDEPVRLLRERLLTDRVSKAHLPSRDVLALTVKAWNLTRSGAKVRRLGWRAEGDSPENFPTIE